MESHKEFSKEGPIHCIFLADFHATAGPRIVCQTPEKFISKEYFDSISTYIIPKPQLQRHCMTINALGHKVIGYPIRIENERFDRNAYLFNVCFVCDSWSKTIQYEPVVKKLGEHLFLLEEEQRFITEGQAKLPSLLAHILHDLNTDKESTILDGDFVLHLKVLEIREDPPIVSDHDVPVIISSIGSPNPQRPQVEGSFEVPNSMESEKDIPFLCNKTADFDEEADWDLTTKQLIPFIDGYNHVLKISLISNIDKDLVKHCIQNLVYFGLVKLLPILKYSNMYRNTPSIGRIFNDPPLQSACIKFVSEGLDEDHKPKLHEIQKVLCALKQGTTLRDVSEKYIENGYKFDIKKLIIFSLMHGMIICLRRYPVYIKPQHRGIYRTSLQIRKLLTGRHTDDEICCIAQITLPELNEIIENDPNISEIWK